MPRGLVQESLDRRLEIVEGEMQQRVASAGLEDVVHARRLIGHPEWFVRVAAARALGRLGGPDDAAPLTAALADPSWWVRYRAAQSLCSIPGMGPAELGALTARLTDRFAADMLRQVLAERAPA